QIRSQPHVRHLIDAVAVQIGAAKTQDDLTILLRQLDRLTAEPDGKALAEQLVKKLVSKQPAVASLLGGDGAGKARELVVAMVRDAKAVASNAEQAPAQRVEAVRTLSAAA